MKYTGPTLAAKGGGDVAMEELVLASEGMEFENHGRMPLYFDSARLSGPAAP